MPCCFLAVVKQVTSGCVTGRCVTSGCVTGRCVTSGCVTGRRFPLSACRPAKDVAEEEEEGRRIRAKRDKSKGFGNPFE